MNRMIPRVDVALMVVLTITSSTHAHRVYEIINYPALQNGYSLNGTITVSDDAPADGMLSLPEIVDWQYSIVGEWSVSASFGPPPPNHGFPLTSLQNIAISLGAIELPLVVEPASELLSRLWLTDIINPGRAQTVPTLHYRNNFNSRTGETLVEFIGSAVFEGDIAVTMWKSQFTLGDSNWVIATYVPEPTIASMGMLALVTSGMMRRVR